MLPTHLDEKVAALHLEQARRQADGTQRGAKRLGLPSAGPSNPSI
jgi:hypothetical protein